MQKTGLVLIAVASLLGGCAEPRDPAGSGHTLGPIVIPDLRPTTPGNEGAVVVLPEGEHQMLTVSMTAEYHSADIVFLMDSTGSMGEEIAVLSSAFGAIVDSVAAVVPDAAFGVAEHRDYAVAPYGGSMDVPFRLDRALTTDVGAVHDALSHLVAGSGGDYPESQYEALYQVATGNGFDLDGNGACDLAGDVAPFIAKSIDAFGGSVPGTHAGTSATGGGAGFREGALHIVVESSDADYRDPDAGWTLGNAGTAPHGKHEAIAALNDAGIHVIGIASGSPALAQMTEVALATSAVADRDGDGTDDVLVYSVGADAEGLPASVADAVERMVTAHETTAALHAEGDEWGFVASAEALDAAIRPGESVSLSVDLVGAVPQTAEEQTFTFTLQLVDIHGAVLGSQPVTVRVPGYSSSSDSSGARPSVSASDRPAE